VVEATAPDSTIEGVRAANSPGWVVGVQWHPEWRFADDSASLALFRAFGAACRAYQQGIRKAA
jgi:putative glutamine amidotransferase